jgi:hypothetical protein
LFFWSEKNIWELATQGLIGFNLTPEDQKRLARWASVQRQPIN